jgi:hypothetical protein
MMRYCFMILLPLRRETPTINKCAEPELNGAFQDPQ